MKLDKSQTKPLLLILVAVFMILLRIILDSKGIGYDPYHANILMKMYINTYIITYIIAWIISIYLFGSWLLWFINTEDSIRIKNILYLCLIIILVVGLTYVKYTNLFHSDFLTMFNTYPNKVDNLQVQ